MSKAGKKKAKKGGKKGKKKDGNTIPLGIYSLFIKVGDDLELSVEEKFKKTSQEVDYLKEQLGKN